MTDYKKYINALRKCAKEHENDRTFTGHIIVSDLCRDTANLLESLEQEPKWTPVNKRLPEAGKQYLCCNADGFREVGYLSKVTGEWGFTDTEAFGEVIAWMPLPEPYKAESEDKE